MITSSMLVKNLKDKADSPPTEQVSSRDQPRSWFERTQKQPVDETPIFSELIRARPDVQDFLAEKPAFEVEDWPYREGGEAESVEYLDPTQGEIYYKRGGHSG